MAMEIRDRGDYFRVDGKRLRNKDEFRNLLAEVIEQRVDAVGIEQPTERNPIAQNGELVAYPPSRDDRYFCMITDGEDRWFADNQMELVHILQRI